MPDRSAQQPAHRFRLLLIAAAAVLLGADDPAPLATRLDSASLGQRRQFVESLTPAEQAELKQKRQRFEQLGPDERERIRQLHEQINGAPDRDQLRAALERYHQWLKTLPSARRAELLSMPVDERLAEMKSIMESQAARRMLASTPLQMSDYSVIKRWLYNYVRRNEQRLLEQLPEQFRRRLDAAPQTRRTAMLASAVIRDRDRIGPLQEADMRMVIRQLSPAAQQALEEAGGRSREVMMEWLRLAGLYQRMSTDVSNEQLRTFYNGLDERLRQRLETLPPAEMRTTLARLYHLSQTPGGAALSASSAARVKTLKQGPPLRVSPGATVRPNTGAGRGLRLMPRRPNTGAKQPDADLDQAP